MSNFAFLQSEWPELLAEAVEAERYVRTDPRSSCFYARRALELAVQWLFDHDLALWRLYGDSRLSELLHEPSLLRQVPVAVGVKADHIRKLGNRAVHDKRKVRENEALSVVKELFHVAHWLAHTYRRDSGLALP